LSRVWLVGVVGFVLALAVAGLVVALITTRDGELLPEDSPEGAVQRYLLALEDEDYRQAYSYLSDDTQTACALEDFVRYASYREIRDSRMTLEDTELLDDTAVVRAEVTVFDVEMPFQPQEYSYTETFNLRLEGGAWRLVSPDYWCPPLR
jgi:hypothetical protein